MRVISQEILTLRMLELLASVAGKSAKLIRFELSVLLLKLGKLQGSQRVQVLFIFVTDASQVICEEIFALFLRHLLGSFSDLDLCL